MEHFRPGVNLRPLLEIYPLRQSLLHTFTLIWHHAFAPCAQLIAFPPKFRPWVQLYEIHPRAGMLSSCLKLILTYSLR
jgi:hypothetical protein